jgi:hypothetical protein
MENSDNRGGEWLASLNQHTAIEYWFLVVEPSGGNFGQNFQISDVPPTPSPPFALEKTVFSTLLDQNFQKFVHFP